MLRPFSKTNNNNGETSQPLAVPRATEEVSWLKRRPGYKMLYMVTIIGIYVGLGVIEKSTGGNLRGFKRSLICTQGSLTKRLGRMRRILCEVETELETSTFEESFSAEVASYAADYDTTRPNGPNNAAFVVTIPSCPEDSSHPVARDDPGAAFYDAAAVLRASVCNCTAQNPESGSKYSSTMYAIIHPEAIICNGPSNAQNGRRSLQTSYTYDRVAILQELGYWVNIWREPMSLSDIPHMSSQVSTQPGIRDLMRLYAFNLTNHPVAVMMSFDTVFTNPLDSIFDSLINDTNKTAVYLTENGNNVNVGAFCVKPSEEEFIAVIDTYKATTYNSNTGWNESDILGLGSGGILTYYASQNPTAYQPITTNSILSFAANPDCDAPWECKYEQSWDNATEDECRELNSAWYEYRRYFEENWSKTDLVNTSLSNFHTDFFLGYCSGGGVEGYTRAADYSSSLFNDVIRADSNTERVLIPQPSVPSDLDSTSRSNCPADDGPFLLWDNVYPSLVEDQDITLASNTRVLVTESIQTKLGKVTIPSDSALVFAESQNGITVDATGFDVQGLFQAGSETCKYETTLTITLHGQRPSDITTNGVDPSYKGLSVTGNIELHGKRYYRTWSRLGRRVTAGDDFLVLQDSVNWEVGQEIVLVTTATRDSRDWHQNEVFTIANADVSQYLDGQGIGAILNLTSSAQYDHIANEFYQAEVGLLTRKIMVQGAQDDSPPTDIGTGTCTFLDHDGNEENVNGYNQITCPDTYLTGYGGHIMVHGQGTGRVEGVELYRMGQTNVLGRYPIHFHLLHNNCPGCYFKDSSVHESYYRCISVHATHNITVSENVGYDVTGYCYYLEDGVEEDNTLSYNLAAHIHTIGFPASGGPQRVNYISASSNLTLPADSTASGFYITNLQNTIIGNVASGGWAGYAFPIFDTNFGPSSPYYPSDFSPKKRPTLAFDGNTAHSTAHFWKSAAAFYFGGSLWKENGQLIYNAGRDNSQEQRRTPCEPDPVAGNCPSVWNHITNSKVYQVANVGIGSWSGHLEVVGFESHDIGLAMEALDAGFWADNIAVVCRSGEKLVLPVQPAFWEDVKANGFVWYDTGQLHIITNSEFRNCGYNEFWNASSNEGCGKAPSVASCHTESSVFGLLTHSDEFNPEVMQSTRNITTASPGMMFRMNSPNTDTVSGRTQSWHDVDGSVSGTNQPTLIASGLSSAGKWWNVDDDVILETNRDPLYFIPKIGSRSLAHIRLEWDASLHSTVGVTQCFNGGNAFCPHLGFIRHLGAAFNSTNDNEEGLPITAQPEVVGLAGGYGWFFKLTEGSPTNLVIKQVEVDPSTPLTLSIPYPLGTNFTVKAKATKCWRSSLCDKYTCEELFHSVKSVEEVRFSAGNAYHIDSTTGVLTIRIVMFNRKYTGTPHWKLPTWDTPGREGQEEYALGRFERAGVLLPHGTYESIIEISADCANNGIYCTEALSTSTSYDNVCREGYVQNSYDRCCNPLDLDDCEYAEDINIILPSESPTTEESSDDIIINGDFEDPLICPWIYGTNSYDVALVENTNPANGTATGGKAITVTNRVASYSGIEQDILDSFQFSTTYHFKATMKVLNGAPSNIAIKIKIRYANGDNTYPTVGWKSNSPVGEWAVFDTTFSFTADPSKGEVTIASIYCETPGSTVDYMVDGVSMTPI